MIKKNSKKRIQRYESAEYGVFCFVFCIKYHFTMALILSMTRTLTCFFPYSLLFLILHFNSNGFSISFWDTYNWHGTFANKHIPLLRKSTRNKANDVSKIVQCFLWWMLYCVWHQTVKRDNKKAKKSSSSSGRMK